MAFCNNSSSASAVLESGGSNEDNPTTNVSYEGVWKRKSKWVTKIRDPIKKRLIWLGTYASPEEASRVYQAKKIELEEKAKAAADKKKRKRNIPIVVSDDLVVAQEIEIEIDEGIEGIHGVEESEKKKRKLNGPTIVSDESDSQEIERKTEDSVFDEGIGDASSDNGGKESESESESPSSSSSDERMEDSNILVRFGPVIINKQGFILGEFSWIDDLSII